MDRLELHITQEDIDTAQVGCEACPIARALERMFPDCQPFVGAQTSISFNGPDDRVVFPHTYESLQFISAYDFEDTADPCTLTFTAGPLHV